MPSALVQAQWRFSEDFGLLLLYATSRGYKVQLAEGHIADSIDKPSEDTPHLRHGCHFKRLAHDLLLWTKNDEGIHLLRMGDHSAYHDIGQFWLRLSPDNAWGGAWGDYGHFSRRWGGVS